MKKIFEKGELKLLWPFYFAPLILGIFILENIFQIPYFIEIGFSLTQVGFLISAIGFGSLLFEVPTGAIADIFGRKFSVVLGITLSGLIFLLTFFIKDFVIFLFLFFILGVAMTLISGAKDAWVIDLLKHNRKKHLIQDYYSKYASLSATGLFLAGLVGAFLVGKFGLKIIWPVTGIAFLLNALIYMFAKEHFIKKKSNVKKQLKQIAIHSKKSISYSLKHKIILSILFSSFIILFVGAFAGRITWYPLLQNYGFNNSWFGYLASVSSLLTIFAPIFIKSLVKKFGSYKKYLLFILVLIFISFISILFVNILIPAILIFLISQFLWRMFSPARQTFFQSFIPSKMRATITSFRTMWVGLAAVISTPLAGFIADKIGPQYTIAIGGLMTIPAIILYWKIKEKE